MQEINVFHELFYSLEVWGYLGPLGIVAIGYYAARKEKILGVMWFIVEMVFVGHYLGLYASEPGYIWHIVFLVLGGLATCVFPLFDH